MRKTHPLNEQPFPVMDLPQKPKKTMSSSFSPKAIWITAAAMPMEAQVLRLIDGGERRFLNDCKRLV